MHQNITLHRVEMASFSTGPWIRKNFLHSDFLLSLVRIWGTCRYIQSVCNVWPSLVATMLCNSVP